MSDTIVPPICGARYGHLPRIGLLWSAPSYTPSYTSSRAHAHICCRRHWPLVVCSLPHALSHLPAVVLMRSSAVVGIVLLWSAPSLTHSLIYQPWCSCAHLLSWALASRGLPPPPHTLSSTSSGAHAPICCRGHRPLVVSPSLTHSLIYQQWCSYAHLLSWASASRGQLPPSQTLSSTGCGAHAPICCRVHRPLVVCSLPHRLCHLPAVVLMRSSAVVDIVLSWSAPSHTLIY